jgi:hypothetical protein
LQERLRAQLMLALYRSGRQAEALQHYQEARQTLTGELGLEPGQALHELEQAILRHDSTLHLREERPATTAATHPSARRRRLVFAAGLGAAIAAAAATIVLTRDSTHGLVVAADSVAVLDPKTNRLAGDIRVGNAPSALAADAGAIWVLNGDDGTISRIDPISRSLTRTFSPGGSPTDLAAGEGSLWLENANATVTRVDETSGLVSATIQLPRPETYYRSNTGTGYVAAGSGAVWATDPGEQAVWRINPADNRVVATIRTPTGEDRGGALAPGPAGVWIAYRDGDVFYISSATNVLSAPTSLPFGLGGLAVGGGSVWIAGGDNLWQIQPDLGQTQSAVTIGSGLSEASSWVAEGSGSIWVASDNGIVTRIDPIQAGVIKTIDLGRPLRGIATGDGAVWIAAG